MKSSLPITYFSVTQSLWNFAYSTAVQSCKIVGQKQKQVMEKQDLARFHFEMSFWTDNLYCTRPLAAIYDDVITWKRFPRFWPFVRGIHLSHAEFPQKRPSSEALMFPLMLVYRHCWTNSWCQWFERPQRLQEITVIFHLNFSSSWNSFQLIFFSSPRASA